MDQSGCTATFPDSEIQRFLSSKTYKAWTTLRARTEIEKAQIDGLVQCPFCDFAAIMDDPTDRIFECLNEACGELSCRYCRVKSHHPLTCARTSFSRQSNSRI
jgi:E3 ubiquitin-protein ligase RNF216